MTMHALDDVARPEWTRERARASSMTIFGMEAPEALALTDALTAAQGRPGRGLLPSVELLVLSDKLEALGYLDTLDDEQRSLLGLASATLDVERDSLYISRLVEALLGRAWMLGTRLDKPEFAERGRTVRFCGTLEWKLIHEREPGEVWMAAAVQATDVQEIVIPRPLRISAWSRAEVLAEIGALYLTPPPWGERADVHALATRCEADRGAFTKAVKKIAHDRFRTTLRASGGRGTGYNWVTIERDEAVDDEAVDDEALVSGHAPRAAAACAAIRALIEPDLRALEATRDEGREPVHRVSLDGGRRWLRGWAICSLAGHPLPEGAHVERPRWAREL